jgi:NTP pyrophosphatase (non-canonical NTP hydrolase)
MDFAEMSDRALEVRAYLEDHERRSHGRPWTTEELTLGLVGDVGDLAKLIQAHEGVRASEGTNAKLRHELADILWSVIVIASRCGVDLEASFFETMDEIQRTVSKELHPPQVSPQASFFYRDPNAPRPIGRARSPSPPLLSMKGECYSRAGLMRRSGV